MYSGGDPDGLPVPLPVEATLGIIVHLVAAAVVLTGFTAYLVYVEPLVPPPPNRIYTVVIHNLHWIMIVEYFLLMFITLQRELFGPLRR